MASPVAEKEGERAVGRRSDIEVVVAVEISHREAIACDRSRPDGGTEMPGAVAVQKRNVIPGILVPEKHDIGEPVLVEVADHEVVASGNHGRDRRANPPRSVSEERREVPGGVHDEDVRLTVPVEINREPAGRKDRYWELRRFGKVAVSGAEGDDKL